VKKIFDKIKSTVKRAFKITEVRYVLWAVLTVFFAEMLSTGPVRALVYPFARPLPFLAAVLIILTSYAVTLLSKRRIGVFILIEGAWVGIAIANCILLSYRVNPLSAVDFSILFSVFSIITVYLSIFQIILIVAAILGALAGVVYCMVRLPSKKPNYKRVITELFVCIVLCVGVMAGAILVNRADMKKMNLPEAYREYGFVYCFSLSTADRGIDRPVEYSEESIDDILEELEKEGNELTDAPNIVIVQLESFMDTDYIIGLETTDDPIPNFRKLRDAFPSGTLTVPTAEQAPSTRNSRYSAVFPSPASVWGSIPTRPYSARVPPNL